MEANEIIKEVRKANQQSLGEATNKLYEIIRPINATKLTWTEKTKFVSEGGFKKAWEQIRIILQCNEYLWSTRNMK